VYCNGKLNVERGAGNYIKRPPFAPYFDAIEKMRQMDPPYSVDRSS